MIAFGGFIESNAMWVVWGFHSDAYALIVLECVLPGMTSRGFRKPQGLPIVLRSLVLPAFVILVEPSKVHKEEANLQEN